MLVFAEIFNSLDFLVRLASLGTAGVSILAIFIIGRQLFNLPNNTSATKASLIKKYMTMCTVIAVICTISGVANAYFNHKKVEKAENNFRGLADMYTEQMQRLNEEKTEIYSTLDSLQTHLYTISEPINPTVRSSFERVKSQLQQLQLTPRDSILNAENINSINNFPINHNQ